MEIYQAGTEEKETETGHHFQIATLPAIVLLKLIAYDDRPEQRLKDARDIANIIANYFDLQEDRIYEHHADLFTEDNEFKLEHISAEVVGREIKAIIAANTGLHERVKKFLFTQIRREEKSSFVRLMVAETDSDVEEMVKWLKLMLKGLDHSALNGK
jgi:predicted nucleotidyltransferase